MLRRKPFHMAAMSYNVGDGPSDAKLADLIRFARLRPHGAVMVFILLQECMDRMDVIHEFIKHMDYGWDVAYMPGKAAGHEAPVLYNKRYAKKPLWHGLLIRIGYLGPKGKGKSTVPYKVLTDVRFWVVGARRFVRVLNIHTVADAFSTHGGEGMRRRAAWHLEANEFFQRALASKCVVIGGGDWNRNQKDIHKPRRWEWDTSGATIRHMEYDNIGHRHDRRLIADGHGIEETDGSKHNNDHRAPWATWELR